MADRPGGHNKSLKLSRGWLVERVATWVYRLWLGEANCALLNSVLYPHKGELSGKRDFDVSD